MSQGTIQYKIRSNSTGLQVACMYELLKQIGHVDKETVFHNVSTSYPSLLLVWYHLYMLSDLYFGATA